VLPETSAPYRTTSSSGKGTKLILALSARIDGKVFSNLLPNHLPALWATVYKTRRKYAPTVGISNLQENQLFNRTLQSCLR
jgi:hypothetical protein